MGGGHPVVVDRDDLVRHVLAAASADILVTIGGASVGDHDLVGPVLAEQGMDLAFWREVARDDGRDGRELGIVSLQDILKAIFGEVKL